MTDAHSSLRQYFDSFLYILSQLDEAVALTEKRLLSSLEKLGLIHVFKYTHELGLFVMKTDLEYHGVSELNDYQDTCRAAFQKDIIADGKSWMEMIRSRNLSLESYNPEVADSLVQQIILRYHRCLVDLRTKMQERMAIHSR